LNTRPLTQREAEAIIIPFARSKQQLPGAAIFRPQLRPTRMRGFTSFRPLALPTGFSSQSRLTENFRRVTGLTLGQFRRSLG
jgi:AraC-like DNA-binding protein